jgi:hypothetical protein
MIVLTCMVSSAVEGSDELDHVALALVLYLLLLHAQVVVVLEVGVHDDLVQVSNDADVGVGLDVVLGPLLELSLLHEHLRLVHDFDVQSVVLLETLELTALGIVNQLQNVVAFLNDFLFLFSAHVGTENLGNNLRVEDLLELIDRILVLASVLCQELVELVLVSRLDVASCDFTLRSAYLLLFDLAVALLEIGEISGGRKEHQEILVNVLQRPIDVCSELANKFGLHIVLHPEEGEVLSQVVYQVEGPFFLQFLTEILLALVGSRLIGTQRLRDLETVVKIVSFITILSSQVFFYLGGGLLEIVHEFFEGRSIILVVGKHGEGDFLPSWVELFGIVDAFVGTLELFDLLK